jgi:hypothetical protein
MCRNRLDHDECSSIDAGAVITFSEIRDQVFSADCPDQTVGQNALQSISYFNAVFFVFHGNDDENTVVLAFLAEFPFFFRIEREFFDALVVKALDRKDQHLRCGFPLKLLQRCV